MKTTQTALRALMLLLPAQLWPADVAYVDAPRPFGEVPAIKAAVPAEVDINRALLVPMLTWAPDGVTVAANGGLNANANSPFARALGRPVELALIDDFEKQIEN